MDFVNEGKLDEERKRRQAEWERVRKPSDPVDAPDEYFDNRSLYERLKEQHDKKKAEFEGQFALKNQIRGVDSEEASFLSEVDQAKIQNEKRILLEEKREIEELKKAATSKTAATSADIPKITVSVPAHKIQNTQAKLLSSVVVAKRKSSSSQQQENEEDDASKKLKSESISSSSSAPADTKSESSSSTTSPVTRHTPTTQIVVGVLPGLGDYDSDSSDFDDDESGAQSGQSDDDDDDDFDELNLNDVVSGVKRAK